MKRQKVIKVYIIIKNYKVVKELKFKINELKDEISEIEVQCQEKLNFGNVPKQNWDEVLQMLTKRGRLVETLDTLEDVKNLQYINAL